MRLDSLTPECVLQVYDAHIEEAASDLVQMQDLRQQMRLQHELETKAQLAYIDHLRRKVTSRAQRGGDLTTYTRALETLYCRSMSKIMTPPSPSFSSLTSSSSSSTTSSPVAIPSPADCNRPVNDVLRRQALLLSVTHQCEFVQNLVDLTGVQGKKFVQSLMQEVSDLEDEKAHVEATYHKRRGQKLQEMEELKQRILTTVIYPQRMVIHRLQNVVKLNTVMDDMQGLQDQMAQRRNRQNKSFQEKLMEKSEKYKQLRRDSFSKARKHVRSNSLGSANVKYADNIAANMEECLWGDDDKSVASNKSGWSMRSGRSAKSGRSQSAGPVAFFGRIFGRTSSTLESEMSAIPPMEISIKPPSSAFMFMNGLGKELDFDNNSEGSASATPPTKAGEVPMEVMVDMVATI